MNIQLYNGEQVSTYEEDIRMLLHVCMDHNFSDAVPETFYDEKLESLKRYLSEGKAYFFAAEEAGRLRGILWACAINTITGPKFHVLYFAVYPESQGTGIGMALLRAAEAKAAEMGITKMELLVSADNTRVVHFYEKCSYNPIRLVLEKNI